MGRAQSKNPRDIWSSRKRRQPVTVPRMLEPRAKVLSLVGPVNQDCRLVSRAVLRQHLNTSGRVDGSIISAFPFSSRQMETLSNGAALTVVSPAATTADR